MTKKDSGASGQYYKRKVGSAEKTSNFQNFNQSADNAAKDIRLYRAKTYSRGYSTSVCDGKGTGI